MPFLKVNQVTRNFTQLAQPVEVLASVSFQMERGEALSITGPSGSGKSTLLHLLGALDQPSSGSIEVDGKDPFALSEIELARFRNETVGFVFQDHHLLPQYSILENVLLPSLAFPRTTPEARARQLLDRVGLGKRLSHRPAELSGGERQRVAIARALINSPALLLCDEPTGNLDQNTAGSVADLLFELHNEENNVLIIVTHSPDLAKRCPQKCTLRNGSLVNSE